MNLPDQNTARTATAAPTSRQTSPQTARTMLNKVPEITAFFWSGSLIIYWLWMLALLTFSLGRVHGLCLLAVIGIGFGLRRNCRLQWILVILTVEGAIRIGLLVSLCALAWRRL